MGCSHFNLFYILVTYIVPVLPYALAFAAGAMVFVVVDDIVPESQAM
jgi:ZIP family zinc transporter